MSGKKLIITAALLAGAAGLAPVAHAAQPGFYVGGGIGQGNDLVLNQTSSAYKIFGGFNVNRFLGMELAYVNLGSNYVAANNVNFTQDGVSYELVGYIPVAPSVNLFGKVGLYNWTTSNNYSYASHTGTNNDYGFGISARVAPQLWLRGEYQKYLDVDGGDVSMASVSMSYHFR